MGTPDKVMVALSGGVDSSVAAAILKKQGNDVIGATLVFRPDENQDRISWCCGDYAVQSASAVANQLGIEHHVVDAAKEFEREILKPSWEEYACGRTPSPCINCNAKIKFGLLMRHASSLGVGTLATGHYALLEKDGERGLFRGRDTSKDQSYFLFALSREQLDNAVFPLGGLKKSEVRTMASKMGLKSANRRESQDACFVIEGGGFSEALRVRFGVAARAGDVVDPRGEKLGRHKGIHLYTIGQRKGLGIAVGCRAYVSGIDEDTRSVTLSDDPRDIESTRLIASDPTWIDGAPPSFPLRCEAQIRYRHTPARAVVNPDGKGGLRVEFDEPQRAIAPGQGVAFFNGDRVLGGGWIDRDHNLTSRQ